MQKISSMVIKYSGVAALAIALVCVIANGCCKKGKVGVLDHQKILTTATSFQTILGEEKKYLDAIAVRKAEDEKNLQIELALLQQKIKVSGKKPEAFKKELTAFQEKVAFYNEKYRATNALIVRASQIARQQLEPFVKEVLNEIGEKGYTVILPKTETTYVMPQADITSMFIEQLNAKNVKIDFPDPAQLAVAENNANTAQKEDEKASQPEAVQEKSATKPIEKKQKK